MGGSQKKTSGRKRRCEHLSDPTKKKNPLGTSGYRESVNKKGPVPKSRENGVITNSRVNAEIKRERRGHQFSCKWKTRREHKVVHTHICLLTQQKTKTRGQSGKGTHHHSFRNVFLHTYPFFGNAYIHTHIIIDTIFAAPCHELGRRRIPNHPPMTSPQARGGLWQSHWT